MERREFSNLSKSKDRRRQQTQLSKQPQPQPQPQAQLEQQDAQQASRVVATRTTRSVSASFEGPLPPPTVLADYDKVFQGCAERIVAMAESQSAHRQELEKTVVSGNVAAERRGQNYAFILGSLAITSGVVLIYLDKNVEGLTAILVTLATLAGVFVYGKRQQAQERTRKAS